MTTTGIVVCSLLMLFAAGLAEYYREGAGGAVLAFGTVAIILGAGLV